MKYAAEYIGKRNKGRWVLTAEKVSEDGRHVTLHTYNLSDLIPDDLVSHSMETTRYGLSEWISVHDGWLDIITPDWDEKKAIYTAFLEHDWSEEDDDYAAFE